MHLKRKIIFDCDPGHDDAIALLMAFAAENIDVLAVTVVGGNQTLKKTLNNTQRILGFAGISCTIAAGCDEPLFRNLVVAPEVHGESGLEGPEIPNFDLPVEEKHAIEIMKDILTESESPITLVATGPLTNVGLLIKTYPQIKDKISDIAIMGGAMVGGNWSPSAEFNILVDPEAAKIVFESGIQIHMAGLDVTHKALVGPKDAYRLRKTGKKVSIMVAELLDFFALFHHTMGFEATPLHDPVTLAYMIEPSLIETKDYYVEIDTDGKYTLGATVVDQLDVYKKPKNTKVMTEINQKGFVELMINLVTKYA